MRMTSFLSVEETTFKKKGGIAAKLRVAGAAFAV